MVRRKLLVLGAPCDPQTASRLAADAYSGRAVVAGEGETPSIILMEPQLADNIGMVARACANFGLDDLRLVNPRDGWPNEKARIAASGANYIIDDAKAYGTLEEGLADLNCRRHDRAPTRSQKARPEPRTGDFPRCG